MITKNNYKDLLKEKHGDKFTFLGEFVNSKTPIKNVNVILVVIFGLKLLMN